MPRLSRLHVGALADLADQLRFAPRARTLAQLAAASALASEIAPEQTYPEDWVVFRITGYRPELDSPALIVGAALRGGLSAFVERVSDRAELQESDLPPFLHIDELTRRWGVSAKTIERARRQGLVAMRYTDGTGVVRLAFTEQAVERYEEANQDRLREAAAFNRIPDAQSRRLAEIGIRAMRRFGWSLNAAAESLAKRSGRGRETMRQLLQRTIDPADRASGALAPRERRVIDRAVRRAVEVRVIATRYDRTPAAIRLIANQRRLSRIKRWRLPDAEAMPEVPAVSSIEQFQAPATIGRFLSLAGSTGKPDAAIERTLATAHRALLLRAGYIASTMNRSAPRAGALDRAEADLRLASILRCSLVGSELALVRDTIEGRLGAPIGALAPAHAVLAHDAAIDALIGAVALFDPSRGGRLAASAGLAINKALAPVERVIREQPDPRGGSAETSQTSIDDWTTRSAPWNTWLDLPEGFRLRVSGLEEPAATAIALLHGLDSRAPMTPAEIAESLGISKVAASRSIGAGKRQLRGMLRDGLPPTGATKTSVG